MEIKALSKSVRISPRKTRLIADAIRKMSVKDALNALSIIKQRAAVAINKTLKSAIANAKNNAKLDEEGLVIKALEVSEGPFLKRFRPSTRGRVHPYKKRTSNITVVLTDNKSEVKKQVQLETKKEEK
jgi:large subunit ribosomal protein L22